MAQEAKHTPMPWAVNPAKAQVDAFAGGTPLPVCQLLWPTDERSEAETEANARLIAAAPDLLAALVAADAFISYHTRLQEEAPACLDLIRVAIAKARSE